MKKFLFLLLAPFISLHPAEKLEPADFLSFQDVPLFYGKSPLKNLKSFHVISGLPLKDEVSKRLEKTISNQLLKFGKIIPLKDKDMKGFGAPATLIIQLAPVISYNEKQVNLSRLSLAIQTSVKMEQTGTETKPFIWEINTFIDSPIESINEIDVEKAITKIIQDFRDCYSHENEKQAPLFYLYQ